MKTPQAELCPSRAVLPWLLTALACLTPVAAFAQPPTVYRVSTLAGSLAGSGSGTDPLSLVLSNPIGLARDSQGNLYVGDYGNYRILKITPNGQASTIAGTGAAGSTGDNGPAVNAQIGLPRALALDGDKYLYLSEVATYRIRRIDLSTGTIATVVGTGTGGFNGDGKPGLSTQITDVLGLAVDSAGNLIIADTDNHKIRQWTPSTGMVTNIAGSGTAGHSGDGTPASAALLNRPAGLAIHPNGDIYFSDLVNGVIQRVHAGTISTVAGNTATSAINGPANQVRVNLCTGMAFNSDDTGLYFTDEDSDSLRFLNFSSQTVTTIAGGSGQGFSGDGGPATKAQLGNPNHVVVEPGSLAFADTANNRIRRISLASTPTISTIAGGTLSTIGDGGPATKATLNGPVAIRSDTAGFLITEATSCLVRRVFPGGVITTLAGDPGSCALPGIYSASADSSGNIYWVAANGVFAKTNSDPPSGRLRTLLPFQDILVSRDQQHVYLLQSQPGIARVWTSTPSNLRGQDTVQISPFAGLNPGSGGDGGPALANVLFIPKALAEDSSGNVYILDAGNHNVRKVDKQTGKISTVVADDRFATASGLAVDAQGYILIAVGNQVVRFSPQGTVNSVVGSGESGLTGDGMDGYLAKMNSPRGLATAPDGTAYFTDFGNNLVRRLTPVTLSSLEAVAAQPGSSGTIPAQVLLKASDGAAQGGAKVQFAVVSGSATLSASSAVTDVHGIASVDVTLTGDSAGVMASIPGLPPAEILITSGGSSPYGPASPSISSANSLSGFGGAKQINAGGWVEIYGANFSTSNRQWSGDDFKDNTAPTSLGNVRVTFNGIPGFVEYISPTQIDCQVPDGIGTGAVSVIVTTSAGSTAPYQMTAADRVPGLLAPAQFAQNGRQYVVAQFQDQTFVGPPGLIQGATFRPAASGERITIYGVGFGASTPAIPAGQIASQLTALDNVVVKFGDTLAAVEYAGAAGGFVGVYQLNIVVPDGVSGDVPLSVSVDGVAVSQQLWITTK